MSDRRPHWDDDVITAVMSALPEQAKRVVGANDVFRIIAAVEDWARWEHVSRRAETTTSEQERLI